MKAITANIIARLSSRTFWITVFTVGLMILNEQWSEAAAVAGAYILGEKALDTAQAVKGQRINLMQAGSDYTPDVVDRSDVMTGATRFKRADEVEE